MTPEMQSSLLRQDVPSLIVCSFFLFIAVTAFLIATVRRKEGARILHLDRPLERHVRLHRPRLQPGCDINDAPDVRAYQAIVHRLLPIPDYRARNTHVHGADAWSTAAFCKFSLSSA